MRAIVVFPFKIYQRLNKILNNYRLIRYARRYSISDDFRYRHKCLADRLLSQGYICSLLVMAPGCIYFAAHKIRSNAVHITMILDVATSAWFIDFCHKAIYVAFW